MLNMTLVKVKVKIEGHKGQMFPLWPLYLLLVIPFNNQMLYGMIFYFIF